ncbi:MAG TPA: hypothetical protein VKC63_06020 [Solirubrobacterales bacterium]|nr:hypothetical protein [Solirubrobacterales bacterium]
MVFLRGMGRGRKIALLVAACVVVLAGLAWLNRPRDEPTRPTVDDAVRSFRAESESGGAGAGPKGPALGVYRYATRGSETVKGAAFGATHDYDGVSTIVLSAGRCGARERWQVLAGRWSEGEACPVKNGETSTTVTEFHEFFGSGQEDSFHCHGISASGTSTLRAGARFSSVCKSEDSSISTASRVVGVERVAVGAESFDAIRVESRSTLGGKTSGSAKREEWRRRSDGLLLRRSAESEADTSAGGGSHYSERYTLQLLSTKPRR